MYDLGNLPIRSKNRIIVLGKDDCWNWTGPLDDDGYGRIFDIDNSYKAHRIVYKYAINENIKGLVIRHTCDNPKCCNPNHLISGTHNDNVQDRVSRNRSAIGVNNGRSKLTVEQVIEIFYDNSGNKTQLAKKFGVDAKVIRDIKDKKKWLSVTKDL